jgi:hypothetical protein
MKKIVYKFSSALFITLLCCTFNLNAQKWQNPAAMEAIYSPTAITVDGKLNEAAWSSAYEYLIFGPNATTTLNAKSVTGEVLVRGPIKDTAHATVKFLRRGMKLYVGISSDDKSVCAFGNGDSWEGDGLFMVVKDATGKNVEFKLYFNKAGVNPNINFETADTTLGYGTGVKGPHTIVNDTTAVDSGYTAELVINLDKMGYTATSTSIPVNIDIFDPNGYDGVVGAWNASGIGTFDKTYWGSEWASDATMKKLILYQDPASIDVPLTQNPVTVDGKLNEGEWSAPINYLVFGPQAATSQYAHSVTSGTLVKGTYLDTTTTSIKFLRNGMNVYLGISSNDKSVCCFGNGDSWEGDGVFMKVQKADGTFQEYKLYFNKTGVDPAVNFDTDTTLGKGAAVKGSSTKVNDTTQVDNGYTAELAIYLNKLGYTTAPATLPVAISVFDPDNYTTGVTAYGNNTGTYYKTWWGSEWGSETRNLNLVTTTVPVELSSFSASVGSGQSVILKWNTATETNNRGFEIQRSSDSKTFVSVGYVSGKGTTTQMNSYSYTDKVSSLGNYYYRLKQIDFDGQYKVTATVAVNINAPVQFSLNQNYPNPFNPSTTIKFAVQQDSKVMVKVFDMLGREVAVALNESFSAGSHSFVFNASKLASGNYIYQITAVGIDGSKQVSNKVMTLLK